MSDFLHQIVAQCKATTWPEWCAFVSGVAQVVMARYNIRFNFIAGMVSTLLYIYVFYSYGLFAESMLNVYYLLISIGGLLYWQSKEHGISHWTKKEIQLTASIMLVGTLLLYVILKQYTSSTVPFFDALVSAIAWAGSWLLMRRKLENWLVLNVSNVMALPLLWYKELSLTALLTLIYIYVAIQGYVAWKKEISN